MPSLSLMLQTGLVGLLPVVTRGYRIGSTGVFKETPEEELKLFTVSFNAANQIFDDGLYTMTKFDHVAETILSGHEVLGESPKYDSADIVLVGLQEIEDRKLGFGNRMREHVLWKNMSKSKIHELRSEVIEHSVPPDTVVEAKRAIEQDVLDFFQKLEAEVERFAGDYGPDGDVFHQHLATASPAQYLLGQPPVEDIGQWKEEVKKPLMDYRQSIYRSLELQFRNLTAAAGSLKQFADSTFPLDSIHESLKPIGTWITEAKGNIIKSRKAYPNLKVNRQGHDAWMRSMNGFVSAYQDVSLVLGHAQQKSRQLALERHVDNFGQSVSDAVAETQHQVSDKVKEDLEVLEDAMAKLEGDLQTQMTKDDFHQHIKKAASDSGKPILQALREEIHEWKESITVAMSKLLHPTVLDLEDGHVEVHMDPQEYKSTTACWMVSHYDTSMYIYVNPWSDWKVKPLRYSSNTCQVSHKGVQKNPGCNIDNIDGSECGKVVNLMLLEASKGDKSVKVCVLNTHMSYKNEAVDRLNILSKVMEETTRAGCDTVVFVGDFNSRMHCDKKGSPEDKPLFATSLENVLDHFCASGVNCMLEKGPVYIDELHQMLNQDEITCWEERSKEVEGKWFSQKGWELISTSNTLKRYGLQEAAMPAWPPTFKLDEKMASHPCASEGNCTHQRCLPDEPTCFTNKDNKFKHNPAWTDRILVKAEPSKVSLSTTEYSRRPISHAFDSDHIPVVAKLALSVK